MLDVLILDFLTKYTSILTIMLRKFYHGSGIYWSMKFDQESLSSQHQIVLIVIFMLRPLSNEAETVR